MIQDIAPHKFHNEFIPDKTPRPDDIVFHFNANGVLAKKGNPIGLPRRKNLKKDYPMIYIFGIDDIDCYMVKADRIDPEDLEDADQYEYFGMSTIRQSGLPKYLIFMVVSACHLAHWYRDDKYCGRCGTELVWAKDERALDCPHCGRRIYPRINPAVIVGVTNGDKIILTKYANRPFQDYALIAGFVEFGETVEQCVRREVKEEVGVNIKNIRYYKSQPWGFADDVLMGFFCDLDGDPSITLQRSELRIGKWFSRDEVVLQHNDLSLTNEMMLKFKQGKEPR